MKDLTKGYPAKVILLFALPLICGNIFQQLYNMADTKIVSTYVGTGALAAVGATAVVSNTIIGFINGLTQGFSILVANSYGARDEKRMHQFVAGSILLTAFATVILMIASFLGIEWVLRLLKTPVEILPDALAYVRIILGGTVCISLYNLCANVLRAVGDSKTPLFCLMTAVILNIGLDLLFVIVFGWGIQGAAIATVIAQACSATLCLGYILLRYRSLIPRGSEWQLSRQQIEELVTSGMAMALMGCIVNIGTVILQSAINGLGTKIVAAHTAGRRLFELTMIVIYTLGFAMTTYVSQNMGAGEYKRIRQGVRHALIIASIESTVLMILTFVFGKALVIWIANTTDPVVVANGVMYIQIGVLFYYILGALFILRCTLQGMGQKIMPICSSVLEMVTKIVFASFLVPVWGYVGVSLTEPISWVIMTIPLVIDYLGYWKKNNRVE